MKPWNLLCGPKVYIAEDLVGSETGIQTLRCISEGLRWKRRAPTTLARFFGMSCFSFAIKLLM